jgi:hypothetical protein
VWQKLRRGEKSERHCVLCVLHTLSASDWSTQVQAPRRDRSNQRPIKAPGRRAH